ncbi:hypothetical protein CFP56_022997 [Quercus suber]|uniref:Uncharacterized protein n=1 Tax=Quercus suber TaxID=58331 RepID=A0AAW0KAB6_QUESU
MVPADFVIPELRHLMTCSNVSSQTGSHRFCIQCVIALAWIFSEGIIPCSLSRRYRSVKNGAQDIMGSNLSAPNSYY